MAFISKVGNVLKQTVGNSSSAINPSLFQSIRSMSSSKIFIGGLSYSTDDTSLREACSAYGEVTETRVIMDRETGRSRGFGFVSFTSSEDASKAIQAMDGQDLHGRRVRVNYATDRVGSRNDWGSSNTGYGGGGGTGAFANDGFGGNASNSYDNRGSDGAYGGSTAGGYSGDVSQGGSSYATGGGNSYSNVGSGDAYGGSANGSYSAGGFGGSGTEAGDNNSSYSNNSAGGVYDESSAGGFGGRTF